MCSTVSAVAQAIINPATPSVRRPGSDTAENVVKQTVGRDLENPDFWSGAIRSLEEPLNRLQSILPKAMPSS